MRGKRAKRDRINTVSKSKRVQPVLRHAHEGFCVLTVHRVTVPEWACWWGACLRMYKCVFDCVCHKWEDYASITCTEQIGIKPGLDV